MSIDYLISQNVDFQVDTTSVQTLSINDAYTLPQTQGLDGQVITSNGEGQSSWASQSTVSEGTTYVYTIPYVCGFQDFGASGDPENRTLGEYETSIQLTNPMRDTAKIVRYAVLLDAGDFDPEVPSDVTVAPSMDVVLDTIPRFYSHTLDCKDILTQVSGFPTPLTPSFGGNVIIESDIKIAASGIYTYYLLETIIQSDTLKYMVQQGVGVGIGTGVGVGAGTSINVVPIEPIEVPTEIPE